MSLSARAQFTPRGDLGRFVPARITPAVEASVTAACKLIEDAAKGYAPVDTGALRDSITSTVEETDKTVVGYVSVGVPYAEYQEYGTGIRGSSGPGAGPGPYSTTWMGHVAHPFMRPAVFENRDAVLDLFRSNRSEE